MRPGVIYTRQVEHEGQVFDASCVEDVSDYLGLVVKSDFITGTLGVPPCARKRRALFWKPEELPVIKQRFIDYLTNLEKQA